MKLVLSHTTQTGATPPVGQSNLSNDNLNVRNTMASQAAQGLPKGNYQTPDGTIYRINSLHVVPSAPPLPTSSNPTVVRINMLRSHLEHPDNANRRVTVVSLTSTPPTMSLVLSLLTILQSSVQGVSHGLRTNLYHITTLARCLVTNARMRHATTNSFPRMRWNVNS